MKIVPIRQELGNGSLIESVLIKGDLAQLTPEERCTYYLKVCDSIGLNPLTQPLQYIVLNNRLTLYARRDAADQLRKINGISIDVVSQTTVDGLLTVHVRAKDKSGRTDEDFGVVFLGQLKGEAAANAMLKAVTKAKRRVTLSISGLGFLDETEIEDIPANAKSPAPLTISATIPPEVPVATINDEGPRVLSLTEGPKGPDYIAFGQKFIAAIDAAKGVDDIRAWSETNTITLASIKAKAPKIHARIMARVETAMAAVYYAPKGPVSGVKITGTENGTLIEPSRDPMDIPASLDRRPKVPEGNVPVEMPTTSIHTDPSWIDSFEGYRQ
jgi:hypothetical protein